MYSAPYGYPNAPGGSVFNGAPPLGAHLQPSPSPTQPQQMMYNAQQFPMVSQPGHFPGGPNPAMMGGAGHAGMMQNAAMPHMAPNGQSKRPLYLPVCVFQMTSAPAPLARPVSSDEAFPSLCLVPPFVSPRVRWQLAVKERQRLWPWGPGALAPSNKHCALLLLLPALQLQVR